MTFDPKAHLIQLPRRVKDKATGQFVTVYDDYLEVKWRVVMFREQYPHGIITTEEVSVDLDRGYARYKATVEDGAGGRATGYGTETKANFFDYAERAETRALGRALATANFFDYAERAETRALGRALATLGFGTAFAAQDLDELPHVADAPVASTNGPVDPTGSASAGDGITGHVPPEARMSTDDARTLKQLAQHVFGYEESARRLRHDLGFEADEKLTLHHLAAHTPVETYQRLRATYEALLREEIEQDVPEHAPPLNITDIEMGHDTSTDEPVIENITGVIPSKDQAEPTPEERQRWWALSRRSLRCGLSPSVWTTLRELGDYAGAERVITALEASMTAPTTDGQG